MSAWDDSHWVQGYTAVINNVFTGGGSSWVDFSHELGRVGWRRIWADTDAERSNILAVATAAMGTGKRLQYRATNAGGPNNLAQITALQTV
ncbi:hypothetical protein [Leifsonia sp. NCR5]|uniref:hypothetical protein n=1 Tax=Leifsonia sp. NCR5 TaxID=1978342 RepID=UPI000A19B304|nr:hypothetical protein [Leifsonia sp. NCR5]